MCDTGSIFYTNIYALAGSMLKKYLRYHLKKHTIQINMPVCY